jgi:hypothetical protein
MAQIGLNITISGLTGKLLIRWVKASSPLAEVGRSAALDFPYDDVYVIPNLSPVVYIVQLWRSDDGVALSQLIKDWSIDASKETRTSVTVYQYKTDRGWTNVTEATGSEVWADPEDGDTNLIDERLNGFTKSQMTVHEAGYGNRLDAFYELYPGGGISLNGGYVFGADSEWFITVALSETITLPADAGSGPKYAGVEVITANQDFDDVTTPLANKLVIANWASTHGQITFPDLTLISDDTYVTFNTHGGSQNYLRLQFDTGDTVKFNNQDVNFIDMAKNERIDLYFYGGICYVTGYDGNALRRGQVSIDYDNAKSSNTLAFLLADEATGVLDEVDYVGLFEHISSLATGVVSLGTSLGQWSYDSGGGVYPNKRFFGLGATTFRVPHLSGMTAKMGSTPGTYGADGIGNHTITLPAGYYVYGTVGKGNLGSGSQDAVKNSSDNRTNVIAVTTGNTETTVKSFQQIPYIVL